MLKFDVNIQALFTERPFLERFEQVSAVGVDAVEFPVPYLFPAAILRERLERFQLKMVLMNSPGGDPHTQRGLACQPSLRETFRESLPAAVNMAVSLGCGLVHCPSGIAPADEDGQRIAATYLENVAFAASFFRDAGITLGIEPINSHDLPGFFVSTSRQALEVVKLLNEPNVGLILDLYHMARMEEDIPRAIRAARGHIAHVQIADAPEKGEPGTGTIDFRSAFAALDEIGYSSFVGLEYRPRATTLEGLSWMQQYGHYSSAQLPCVERQ